MNDAQTLTIIELSKGEYIALVREPYKIEIRGAIMEYLLTDKPITAFRAAFKRAIADSFDAGFFMGYGDAGGDTANPDADDQGWLAAKIDAEFGHVDLLFQQLKAFRKDPETGPGDYQAEAERRAEGYAKTLDGVYNEGKLRGSKDVLAIMDGDDGQESCPTCQRLKGQKHRLSWWVRRGLIPGEPGNPNYDCHGYNCRHYLYNAKTGELLTI